MPCNPLQEAILNLSLEASVMVFSQCSGNPLPIARYIFEQWAIRILFPDENDNTFKINWVWGIRYAPRTDRSVPKEISAILFSYGFRKEWIGDSKVQNPLNLSRYSATASILVWRHQNFTRLRAPWLGSDFLIVTSHPGWPPVMSWIRFRGN